MTFANRSASLAIIRKEEGGNDDDPRDPGGRTSRGITQREWNAYRTAHPGRPSDVWQASDADIDDIYLSQYWLPYCDQLPSGIDLVFFNTAVNSGRQQAVRELQRAVGVNADGMMGIITLNVAINANADETIKKMCDARRKFYRALSTFKTFGKGWLARTDRIEKAALNMAVASSVHIEAAVKAYPAPDTLPAQPAVTISAKADIADAADVAVSPEASGATAAGSATIAGTISQIQQQLQPFADTLQIIQYVLLGLSILGIGYMVYGMIKRARIKQAIA